MRLFYLNFPGGWPGVGLLLLRAAIGLNLVVYASTCVSEPRLFAHGIWASGLLAFAVSLSFLAGFLTQVAGVLFVLAMAAVELFHPAWGLSVASLVSFNQIAIAIAICLLGPGAFSLDAHFFGRRKVVIPRAVNS